LKHWPLFLAILAVVGAATWYDLSPQFPIRQGLDLKGGMRVVLEVDKAKLSNDIKLTPETAASVRQILTDRVNAFGISGATVQSKGENQFVVELPASPPQLINAESEVDVYTLRPGTNTLGSQGTGLTLKDVPAKAATIDFEGATVTVKAEADGVKVGNTDLPAGQTKTLKNGDKLQVGKHIYELNLPQDAQSMLGALQKTAVMKFYWFRNVQTQKNPNGKYLMSVTPGGEGEADIYKFTDAVTKKPVTHTQVIQDAELIVSGEELRPTSKANFDPSRPGEVVVSFEFKSKGASQFAEFTRNHVGDILAIVLDETVISAPNIESEIPNGQGQISGGFKDMSEARLLAQLMNAGSLPVPLKPAQTQIVGATLGQDSVESSIKAGLWGLAAVLVFMLLYYRLPGFLADVALLFYAALTFAVFKLMNVVMDLPGITGFILSVGMAVDANILIFERLKEEMKSGKTLHAAIDAGFNRAFTSIFDSNMTTWLVCAVLMWLGSPLIKGFALTLAIGVAVSMFTALTVTRTMLHLVVNFPWARSEAMFGVNTSWLSRRFGEGRYMDVWGARRIYFGFSMLLMVVGLAFIGYGIVKPGATLRAGIDFTGGSIMQLRARDKMPDIAQVRSALAGAGLDATPQMATDASLGQILMVRTGVTDQAELQKLQSTLVNLDGGMEVLSTDAIGPTIAKEVTRNAFFSVIVASLLICLYLAMRFAIGGFMNGLKFGVCAVIALLHDVITVTGIFAVMGFLRGWHVDSLFVTAMLTVIGFSVHDTIVVYDRIRENLRNRQRGETFEHLANRSITQTFDRSINTSMTVVLVLVSLLLLGGQVTALFNWALLIGIVIGTYSSIFVASPLVVMWERYAGAKAAGQRAAGTSDVRLRSTSARTETARPRPVPAGSAPRSTSRVTTSGDGASENDEDTLAGGRGSTATTSRQQIKPKRKRRQ
jgi:SecD/SecF fusion protein